MDAMDIRDFGDDELTLWVFNEESLYSKRRVILLRPCMLDDYFIYTKEQLDVCLKDIENDLQDEA